FHHTVAGRRGAGVPYPIRGLTGEIQSCHSSWVDPNSEGRNSEMRSFPFKFLLAGSLTLFAAAANAQTALYDNLSATASSHFTIATDGPLYSSFSTGSSGGMLNDLKL